MYILIVCSALAMAIVFIYFEKILPAVLRKNRGQIPEAGFHFFSMAMQYSEITKKEGRIPVWSYSAYISLIILIIGTGLLFAEVLF